MRLDDRPGTTTPVSVLAYDGAGARRTTDDVATEEPLEIRVTAGGKTRSLVMTMRTPGSDFELAVGFLYAEGVVRSLDDVREIAYCLDPEVDPVQRYNVVNVALAFRELPRMQRLERNFTMNSACGVCGKATIDGLRTGRAPLDDGFEIELEAILAMSDRMRSAQHLFASTGGLHAVALFDRCGDLVAVREDVGRHNAFDKIVGWGLMGRRLPFSDCAALVSGRASYELVQKSVAAGISVLSAVSAPSSLAVALAREFNVTLVGFVRGSRCNVYSAPARVKPARTRSETSAEER